uniref:WAP domain-containing protein n=1 Tax=Apteryx owenii TaxID=8824 RepID=A0A8B9P203_APTOW
MDGGGEEGQEQHSHEEEEPPPQHWCCSLSNVSATGKPEKLGSCPRDFTRCLQLETPLCANDSSCPGRQKCCHWDCRLRCRPPAEGTADRARGSRREQPGWHHACPSHAAHRQCPCPLWLASIPG